MIFIEIINNEILNIELEFDDFSNIKKHIEKNYKINIHQQLWYFKNNPVNILINNNKYFVYKNDYINIKIKNINNIINLPQVSLSTTIKEINCIFNFNNLYYKNKKLKYNSPLAKYNISDNSILYVNN